MSESPGSSQCRHGWRHTGRPAQAGTLCDGESGATLGSSWADGDVVVVVTIQHIVSVRLSHFTLTYNLHIYSPHNVFILLYN